MSLDFTPLLTAHLFVADTVLKKELERFVERMEESHITVNQYAAGHPLQETFSKDLTSIFLWVRVGARLVLLLNCLSMKKTLVALSFT